MCTKEIKIKLSNIENLSEVLVSLGFSNSVNLKYDILSKYFSLNIQENKNLYKALSTSPFIEDWDFVEEKNIKEPNTKDIDIDKCGDYTISQSLEDIIEINQYNELSTLIEAVWRLSKKSPALIFESSLFNESIKLEYGVIGSTPLTIEHSLLNMILESYYSTAQNFKEAKKDCIEKLKNLWKELPNHDSIASVSRVMFK